MPAKKTISIVTLGCAKNQSDTDNLARQLRAKGHAVVADPADAAAIVVHTCSFIEAAKKESIDAILQAGHQKRADQQLIVTGCLVQQHGEEIFKDLPEVDAFLGTGQLGQVADLLDQRRARFLDKANPGGFLDPDIAAPSEQRSATAYLRLSEGCRHPCTFCVIPRLRGKVQSRSEDAILTEARALAAQGVEELVVIGQDTGDWGDGGRQGDASSLAPLLRKVADIPGIRWVRLMYLHPASFTDSLLDVFGERPEQFPYLDMPLQHIDSQVLGAMKRKTDEAGLRRLMERLRTRAPHLTLRTTFIVGFPGETDAQFERLLRFVGEGVVDTLGAFTYSREDGTPAALMPDQVPDDVKKDRLTALTDAYYQVALAKAQKRLGSEEDVLIEESDGDTVLGRTRCEAPDIDAVIRLPASAARDGRWVSARLSAYDAYEFTAEPIVRFSV